MNHAPALKTATQLAVRAVGDIDAAAADTRVLRAGNTSQNQSHTINGYLTVQYAGGNSAAS